MRTRAAILRRRSLPLDVEEIELDPPGEGEVLLRVAATAICHSDMHGITGRRPGYLPMVLGHEGAGVIEAVGPGVSRVRPQDRVILTFVPSCGHCWACVRGRTLDCERGVPHEERRAGDNLGGSYRMHSLRGEELGQAARLGVFAGHTVVSQDSCLVVPPDTNLVSASLLSCGITTGLGAALNQARIELGESVVVVGAGGVGVAAIQGAVIAGAGEVIAVDRNPAKLEYARRFGATQVVEAGSEPWPGVVKRLTAGRGADRSILAINRVMPADLSDLVGCLRSGGVAVIVGTADLDLSSIEVSPSALVSQHKSIVGSVYGSSNPQRDAMRYLDLYRAGRLSLDAMVTKTYRLDDINAGFEDLLAGRNVRGVVTMDGR